MKTHTTVACLVTVWSAAAGAAPLADPSPGLAGAGAYPDANNVGRYDSLLFGPLSPPDRNGIPFYMPPPPPRQHMPPLPSVPQECRYNSEPGSPGKLLLSVDFFSLVTFACPDRGPDTILPSDPTKGYAVGSDGSCDMETPVDLKTVLHLHGRRETLEVGGAPQHHLLLDPMWPVDKDRKVCFVCKTPAGRGADKACHVIITAPRAELPNTRTCDPYAPPNANMVGFKTDESDKAVTLLCPQSHSPHFSPDREGYFATGPDCRDKKKLEEILGAGATFQQLPVDSEAGGDFKSYRIAIPSLPPTPRFLCMDCTSDNGGKVRDNVPAVCSAIVFAPAKIKGTRDAGEQGDQSRTTSNTATPLGGSVLHFFFAAVYLSTVPALASLVV